MIRGDIVERQLLPLLAPPTEVWKDYVTMSQWQRMLDPSLGARSDVGNSWPATWTYPHRIEEDGVVGHLQA